MLQHVLTSNLEKEQKQNKRDRQCQKCLKLKITKYFKSVSREHIWADQHWLKKLTLDFVVLTEIKVSFLFAALFDNCTKNKVSPAHTYISDQSKQRRQFLLSVKKFKGNWFCLFVSIFCSFQPKIVHDRLFVVCQSCINFRLTYESRKNCCRTEKSCFSRWKMWAGRQKGKIFVFRFVASFYHHHSRAAKRWKVTWRRRKLLQYLNALLSQTLLLLFILQMCQKWSFSDTRTHTILHSQSGHEEHSAT